MDLRMGPVLLLLLLPPLLSAQVSTFSQIGTTTFVDETVPSFTPSSPDPTDTAASDAPEEDWTPAQAFLYSGDASVLEVAECDRAYSLSGQTGTPPRGFYGPLRSSVDALTNTANFLNMIFQASDLRESSVREDMEWYHAMVRALLEANPLIRRALLTFDADPAATSPQLTLRASRNPAHAVHQNILLQDLSSQWDSLHPPAPAPDDTWFSSLKFPASSNQPALSKRVLFNDLSTLDTPKWGQGDSYVTNRSGVRWADGPFLECEDGRFLPGWLLTLSTSFYGLKPDLSPEFRGVIRVDVNVQSFDLNQCATGDAWFANTHECNRTTMECEPITGQGFRLGQYCCRCKEGYYSPPMEEGGAPNASEGIGVCYPALPICLPCWPGCMGCVDSAPCWVAEDWFLRACVLSVQGFFMLLVFISMLVSYQFRRSRRIRASGLLLLETILFGSLLLYFPVFILYFRPSTFRCILLRWVRHLGFAIVYGTVTLKMYRVLKVFPVTYCPESALHVQPTFAEDVGNYCDGQGFSACDLDRWDYMMAVAELLFLCWGCFLCSAVKPVPSAFHEPRYMGIAIHNELLLSSMFHLLRFAMPSLHPDWMLSFHVSRAGREEIAEEVYEDEVDLRRSGSYLNSSFTSAVWTDHSLDPDDIRDELKKLYAQLEVHKTKKMTANNPHLQKKRSSRRGLGRSIIKRISEIPESMSRQCSREDKEVNMGHRGLPHSESCKRVTDTVSVNYKDEPVKQPSPVLRKSQSYYDNVKDSDLSLHNSMLRANIVKRCSQRSEDSLDIAPLVCKSASALNLTVDNDPLLPELVKIQRSVSLSSSKAHSLDDSSRGGKGTPVEQWQSKQEADIKDQTSSALVQSQSYDKAEVCPWELEEHPADKNQPHVTFAPSQEEPLQSPESFVAPTTKHVCPWDHLPDPIPAEHSARETKDGAAECEFPRIQAPISTSVSKTKWLSVRALLGSMDTSVKEKLKAGDTIKKRDSISQEGERNQGSESVIATSSAEEVATFVTSGYSPIRYLPLGCFGFIPTATAEKTEHHCRHLSMGSRGSKG
ncbi:hypothetical protein UPYG_G00066480 [Umbra pygmaea]|uniref:G-protein coupled receptors family 3 profile domain-containing protein n=1 Tax=Umbra pygmaea TaxID=75934 RepID=A0ABD0XAJ2_UMBPY